MNLVNIVYLCQVRLIYKYVQNKLNKYNNISFWYSAFYSIAILNK